MDDAAASADTLVADPINWPLSAGDRMSPVDQLVQGEMQGRAMWDSAVIGTRAREATSTPAEQVLPQWHDVTGEDIGFLRARLARLQATVAAVDSAVLMLYGQRHWAPHASASLRHLVNHGFPELEESSIW